MFNIIKLLIIFIISLQVNALAETKKEEGRAIFAGGCFWCMEHPFEELEGVKEVISGYTAGHDKNPTYKEVSGGTTGHVEAVQIKYDPKKVSYSQLLNIFWRQIDPTDSGGQFVDRGEQYTTGIFYINEEQKKEAEKSKEALDKSGIFSKPIITPIKKAEKFYAAENYHQDYYKNNSFRYKMYRFGSGRDKFLDAVWTDEKKGAPVNVSNKKYKKTTEKELSEKLTDIQYNVTQKEGTEKPFDNEYWNNKKSGIYVDIVSGEPLFSSSDKYDSKTGWPSFTKPLEAGNIVEKVDRKLFMKRTEVRSKYGDSHLGHLFNDGPPPTGLRYCINSASLRFIPKEELEKKGYGDYKKLFK